MSLTSINGLLLKKMIISGANELNKNKQLVDSLNVFPVPDGDTGTNMSLTALAAAKECSNSNSLSSGIISNLAANGSLRGARGNSGVILSQLFRGFSKGLEGLEEAGVTELAEAFRKAVETAYKAVMKPKEGTILTVARACAESAEKMALETEDIEEFFNQIIIDGTTMLSQTKEMLPVLKQANVVDAGGKGLIFLLEGAYKSIHVHGEVSIDEPLKTEPTDFSALVSVDNSSITFGYCTEFFINVKNIEDAVISDFKSYLTAIGDSLVVVNTDDIVKVHVHTDHPGLVLEKALDIGGLSGLKIDNMREQHTNKIDFAGEKNVSSNYKVQEKPSDIEKDLGFISISAGSGLNDIFKNLGVDEIIEGGQTMNPSTEDILNAINKINAKNIIVLPNNKNIILASEQAASLTADKKIFVLPTKTIPEGICAMLNYEVGQDIEEIFETMNDSISSVKTGMVTYAVRETSVDDKKIEQGDILGMFGGKIVSVSKDLYEGTISLIDQSISPENEMVSIYYGADVSQEDAEKVLEYIEDKYPNCEAEIHFGNQPLYYYIISIE